MIKMKNLNTMIEDVAIPSKPGQRLQWGGPQDAPNHHLCRNPFQTRSTTSISGRVGGWSVLRFSHPGRVSQSLPNQVNDFNIVTNEDVGTSAVIVAIPSKPGQRLQSDTKTDNNDTAAMSQSLPNQVNDFNR